MNMRKLAILLSAAVTIPFAVTSCGDETKDEQKPVVTPDDPKEPEVKDPVKEPDPVPPVTEPENKCGNNALDAGEVCDGVFGVPTTCSEWRSDLEFEAGGKPACASDCKSIEAGSCKKAQPKQDEPACGNGVLDPGEACDGDLNVPETCSEWRSDITWEEKGSPMCSEDCMTILSGSCYEANSTAVCGNGMIEGAEICDGDAVPTCAEWNPKKNWTEDGKPECGKDCASIKIGTCKEASTETENAECGNGILENDEVCDKKAGVPSTCKAWDSEHEFLSGGLPACSSKCDKVVAGTCKRVDQHTITFLNYNVLFEYTIWMPSGDPFRETTVADRAKILYNNLKNLKDDPKQEFPAFFAIVEASPQWHDDKVTELFTDLGYTWVDNINYRSDDHPGSNWDGTLAVPGTGAYYHSDILYQADRFELLEYDWLKIAPYYQEWSIGDLKTGVMCGVFKEKATNEIFLTCSTHWEANNVYDPNPQISDSIGWVVNHEMERIQGAKESHEFIEKFKAKYPNAHILYGGDLNTFDLRIVFNNEIASIVLGKNNAELAERVNILIGGDKDKDGIPYPVLTDDFMGAHETFRTITGLKDARSTAIEEGVAVADVATNHDPQIPEVIGNLNVPIVIDYAFFSDDMILNKYEVMNAPEYDGISDHYAIKTSYTYFETNKDAK